MIIAQFYERPNGSRLHDSMKDRMVQEGTILVWSIDLKLNLAHIY